MVCIGDVNICFSLRSYFCDTNNPIIRREDVAIVRHLGFVHVAKVGKGKVAKSVLQRRDVGELAINLISSFK